MGMNYYRISNSEEIAEKQMNLNSSENIKDFLDDFCVHLGKKSAGWRFVWNFNNNLFYSNKKELLEFIKNGFIIDENNKEIDKDEFIKIAIHGDQSSDLIYNQDYINSLKNKPKFYSSDDFDYEIDGLVISSSSEFI